MYVLILGFITAFSITYLAIPAIITVAQARKLFDQPNNRSSHESPTPSLGGIGIFGGAICGIILWTPTEYFGQLQYALAAMILLFLVGTRDDLVPIPPLKKLLVQFIAALVLVFKARILVDDWWGLLGINEMNAFFSYLFSVIAIVGIINAYNLIDGINGLAGSIGLIASLFFGCWFFLTGYIEWAVLAVSMAGALTAFLKFNFTPARIFMGDTGSLLVGLTCAAMAFEFIHLNKEITSNHVWFMPGAPVIALSVLTFPIYDTMRVFIRRMVKGRSPFHADKTHVHHMLLEGGCSHMQATGVLAGLNILMIALMVVLQPIGLNKQLLVLFAMTLSLNFALNYWLQQKKSLSTVN